jgi:tetratricopeptide (TPR) repeat protein
MGIKIFNKEEFRNLILNGVSRDFVYPKLKTRVEGYKEIIDGLAVSIPTNYKETALKNNIDKYNAIHINNLTGILCLVLQDAYDNERPSNQNKFNYTLKHLQKIFAHLDTNDLKKAQEYLPGYNELIEKLTQDNHPFGKISLDENWNIVGEKAVSIENYKNNLINDSKAASIPKSKNKKKWHQNYWVYVSIVSGIILIITIFNQYSPKNASDKTIVKSEPILYECIFDNDTTQHKILILPFKNIQDGSGKQDIGFVLKQRIDSLSKADGLNINIKFCKGLVPKEDESYYYESLKGKYNANHIIYGFVTAECSQANQKICLNYITEYKNFENLIENQFTESSYGNFKEISLEELNKGSLQEKLDFLIYWNALVGALNTGKFEQVILYSDKLLGLSEYNHPLIQIYRGLAYREMYKYELAMISLHKAAKAESIYSSLAYEELGNLYYVFEDFKKAKICYERALKNRKHVKTYHSFYIVNDSLKKHQENILLMREAISFFPSEYQFQYYMALSKKQLGRTDEFKKDSIALITKIGENEFSEILAYPIRLARMINKVTKASYMRSLENRLFTLNTKKTTISDADSLFKDFCRIKTFYPDYFFDEGRNISFIYKGDTIREGPMLIPINKNYPDVKKSVKFTSDVPNLWPDLKFNF